MPVLPHQAFEWDLDAGAAPVDTGLGQLSGRPGRIAAGWRSGQPGTGPGLQRGGPGCASGRDAVDGVRAGSRSIGRYRLCPRVRPPIGRAGGVTAAAAPRSLTSTRRRWPSSWTRTVNEPPASRERLCRIAFEASSDRHSKQSAVSRPARMAARKRRASRTCSGAAGKLRDQVINGAAVFGIRSPGSADSPMDGDGLSDVLAVLAVCQCVTGQPGRWYAVPRTPGTLSATFAETSGVSMGVSKPCQTRHFATL